MERNGRPYRDCPEKKSSSPLMPLGDVRFTLQENCSRLSNQNLLSDLLQSIDEKLAKTSQHINNSITFRTENPVMSYRPPNKDPGPGLVSASSAAAEASVQHIHQDTESNSNLPKSVNASTKDKSHELLADIKIFGKHVTFDEFELDGEYLARNIMEGSRSHELLKQLASLRWKLAGWEEEGMDPPSDNKSSLIFLHKLLHMLQVHQEQKKHLEERLVSTERKLKRKCEESEILKNLNKKTEIRVREVDAQIELMQREWITTQAVNCRETLTLQKECDLLKKERNSLRDEVSVLEKELQKYRDNTKDYQKTKIEMSQKHLQMVESHKEEEEDEAEENLDDEDKEKLEVRCESDSNEVGAEIIVGPMDITVLKGQAATLTATFTGKPEPLVSWFKKGQEITDGGRYSVTTENGITTLIIHDIVQEDCDKYTVVVRNSLGDHAAFASLSVGSAPEPPADRPIHSEVTADSVTLSWYGPTYDGGSVVTGYIVQAHKIGNGDWFTLISGSHSTSYIAKGLDTNCQYEFRVYAQNIHGISEPSKPSIPVTTSAPADREDKPEIEDFETTFASLNIGIEPGFDFDLKYKMHEEVGRGSFGTVYRVTFKDTGARRAAKIIKCIKAKEKEKVREEISIMNSLRHPKLVQLGAAYEREREIIMVLEYISGGELFELVVAEDFALTERDCILFLRQICEGVGYMHKAHIVHLDLKPENILCISKTSHQIKLIDFGLARRFNPDDPCRVIFGTPEFIAPEVISYDFIGLSTDMWSVGVICYVLLSGLSPFMGDNDAETFANITLAEFDFDDDAFTAITENAKDFIRSLLIKKKEKRLTAEECFNHPWLAQTEEDMNKVVLSTDKLKKFIIRRNWQRTGNAIHALGRMANLTNRRSSQPPLPI